MNHHEGDTCEPPKIILPSIVELVDAVDRPEDFAYCPGEGYQESKPKPEEPSGFRKSLRIVENTTTESYWTYSRFAGSSSRSTIATPHAATISQCEKRYGTEYTAAEQHSTTLAVLLSSSCGIRTVSTKINEITRESCFAVTSQLNVSTIPRI